MSLPKAVQDALAQADAAQQALNAPEATDHHEPQDPTPEPETPEPPAPEPPKADDPHLWEQRYRSYKGHADAELARMREAMQQMQAEVEALKRPAAPATAPEPDPEITSADVDTFGKDLIDLQERVARKVMADSRKLWEAERQALLGRIGELEGSLNNVGQQVHQTAEERFWSRFETAVPDWETVNADQRFLAWLSEADPLSGVGRQELLNHARQALDAPRLAAIFDTWKRETGVNVPAPKRSAQQELERQVSPRKGASSGGAPAPAKHWSQDDIRTFYNDMVRGKYTQEVAARIEAEIQQAVTEGRVR